MFYYLNPTKLGGPNTIRQSRHCPLTEFVMWMMDSSNRYYALFHYLVIKTRGETDPLSADNPTDKRVSH